MNVIKQLQQILKWKTVDMQEHKTAQLPIYIELKVKKQTR